MRFGGFFQIPPEQIERAERFTQRYQDDGIFFARLLPVICHSISIPAGIIRMGFLKFSVLTVIGSAIWCPVLTVLGQKGGAIGRPTDRGAEKWQVLRSPHLVHAAKHEVICAIVAIVLVCGLYFLALRLTDRKGD